MPPDQIGVSVEREIVTLAGSVAASEAKTAAEQRALAAFARSPNQLRIAAHR